MPDIRLMTYLKENLPHYDKYDLGNRLIAAGHSPQAVKEALQTIEHETMPSPPAPEPPQPPLPKKWKQPSPLPIFLLGLFLAAFLLALIQPQQAVVLPMATEALPLCKACEFLDGNICKRAACCADTDCEDGTAKTADVCEASGTKDARCVRSEIICGNNHCEKGEKNCCLDCGCAKGYVCVENACKGKNI